MQRRPRVKDEAHRKYIQGLPCLLCGDPTSTECAHIRFAEPMLAKPISGMGNKSDDSYTVPLCGKHHREQTNYGDERGYWERLGVPVLGIAQTLYINSGNQEFGERITDFVSGVVTRFALTHD